jgi:hypothetical protein
MAVVAVVEAAAVVGVLEGVKDPAEAPAPVIARCASCAGKEGHTVLHCYKCFDTAFTGVAENKNSSGASAAYGVDTN